LNIHAGDMLSFNVPGETVSSTPKTTKSTIRLTVP
jgi:hypothetical protein